ncbi:hypothetical protein Glove_372g12 [Diversispora epigaea]|uniref:Uncharacterized protein n=1 Tax=Diversispora epigaea TaxID=1348612 RepID=A0A397HE15_9GLOM|nr:hypothetical protein Glove_372g12 [Diversispora epigaea]
MRKVVSFKRVSRTRLEWGNAIPLTTGKVLLLQIIPYFMERKSGEFNIVILWNLDFGHDDSDDNDGDDDDDDGDDGEVSSFDGYLVVFFVIICWDVMTGLFGYRLCWNGREIL